MKLTTTLMGMITAIFGVLLITKEGVLFTEIAFPLGLLFVIVGIIECISYKSYRGDEEEKSWVLIDGASTFVLGFIIVMNQITLESIASSVMGFWVIIIGIRNFVRAFENSNSKKVSRFYNHLIIGLLNFIVGFVVFLNSSLLNLPTILLVGLCVVVEGINLVNVGLSIILRKITFIQTKAERITDIENKAKKSYMDALKNLRDVERSKNDLNAIKDVPEEFLDLTLRTRPVYDEDNSIERAKRREEKLQARKQAQLKRQKEKEQRDYERKQEQILQRKMKETEEKSIKNQERKAIEEAYRKSRALQKVEDKREREANRKAYALQREQIKLEAKNRRLEAKELEKEKRALEEEARRKEKEALDRERQIEAHIALLDSEEAKAEALKKEQAEKAAEQKRLDDELARAQEEKRRADILKERQKAEKELKKKSLVANEFEIVGGDGPKYNLNFAILEDQKETEVISEAKEFEVTVKDN
ncbi:MAG: DUF308 domain-containing protein [Clostridia bacterium]|nr:DUF308 domain-containing protein [Clostridia bacterium]